MFHETNKQNTQHTNNTTSNTAPKQHAARRRPTGNRKPDCVRFVTYYEKRFVFALRNRREPIILYIYSYFESTYFVTTLGRRIIYYYKYKRNREKPETIGTTT